MQAWEPGHAHILTIPLASQHASNAVCSTGQSPITPPNSVLCVQEADHRSRLQQSAASGPRHRDEGMAPQLHAARVAG